MTVNKQKLTRLSYKVQTKIDAKEIIKLHKTFEIIHSLEYTTFTFGVHFLYEIKLA